MRAGVLGGITSFIGFTLPSVIALIIFALLFTGFDIGDAGWIHGLKIVAVEVVAHEIIGMNKNLTSYLKRKAIAIFALLGTLLWQSAFTQVGVILIAAFFGFLLFKEHDEVEEARSNFPISKRISVICLLLFFGLLFLLPVIREVTGSYWIAMYDSLYRPVSLGLCVCYVVLNFFVHGVVQTGW